MNEIKDNKLGVRRVLTALAREEWGDAELLAELYAGRIRYSYAGGCWQYSDGDRWVQDVCNIVTYGLIANGLCDSYLAVFEECSDAGMRDQIIERVGKIRTHDRIVKTLALASSMASLTHIPGRSPQAAVKV